MTDLDPVFDEHLAKPFFIEPFDDNLLIRELLDLRDRMCRHQMKIKYQELFAVVFDRYEVEIHFIVYSEEMSKQCSFSPIFRIMELIRIGLVYILMNGPLVLVLVEPDPLKRFLVNDVSLFVKRMNGF